MTSYLWLKAFHIIFMVAWYAGLFYIFRLFVYHVKNWDDERQRATFSTMERKLLFIIMYPAMILSVLFGMWMVVRGPSILMQTWFLIKLVGVLGLIVYQFYATMLYSRMAAGERPLSERACRILNEVPTVLLFLIIIMVILKPFSV